MTCPACGDPAAWTRCWTCDWTLPVEPVATTDVIPETMERQVVPDTRSEEERKRDARPVVEALGWIVLDQEQGYRPDACPSCGGRLPGGYSTRVRAGLSDWIVMGHECVAMIEWKSERGRQTPTQRAFEDDCHVAGIPYRIVKTTEETLRFLAEVLEKRRPARQGP